MISAEMAIGIDRLMSNEDSEAIVKYMMEKFAQNSVKNARSLLEYSNHLIDVIIASENARKNEFAHAVKMLMLQRSFDQLPSGYDPGVKLSVMLPVCKTIFPNGRKDCSSKAYEKYFDEMCSLLRDEENFSWDKDGRWADYNNYSEYIKMLENQLADSK